MPQADNGRGCAGPNLIEPPEPARPPVVVDDSDSDDAELEVPWAYGAMALLGYGAAMALLGYGLQPWPCWAMPCSHGPAGLCPAA